MPYTNPPSPPTLTGNALTIDRMLQSPAYLRRRLRSYQDLRFVADQILTGRYRSAGGAILYDQSEPFVTDRAVRSVPPGSEYPVANMPTGTAGLAAVADWGQKVKLTFAAVNRSRYPGDELDRSLAKVMNTIIAQVDSVALSAFAAASTNTFAVGTAWTAASPTILRDLLRARAQVMNLKQGYNLDTLLMNEAVAAYVMSDTQVTNALRRETTDNPIYSGEIDVIAGLGNIIQSPSAPADPWLLDSANLGGMGDEQEIDPGYTVAEQAIQIRSWIDSNGADCWWLQGRRITVPVVQEPSAAVRITGHLIT